MRDLPQRHREHREERAGNKGRRGTPIPGVCVRVAGKGVTRQGVCKSGKQRTYRRVFLRFWHRRQRFEDGGSRLGEKRLEPRSRQIPWCGEPRRGTETGRRTDRTEDSCGGGREMAVSEGCWE